MQLEDTTGEHTFMNIQDNKYKKVREWEQLQREYPTISPFVLLKLSMIWHGVALTERAMDRVQAPDYCFGKLEPFGLAG